MRHIPWIGLSAFIGIILTACSSSKVVSDTLPDDLVSQKIDLLNSALSHAQSRLEELDAKVSALSDKIDATRIMVDAANTGKSTKTENQKTKNKTEKLEEVDEAIPLFTAGMNVFKSAKYSDAELEFSHFTETYPKHVLAGSAQYYAGESYFMMGEYKLAINEYQKVLTSFTSSPRVASAIVRISHCYTALGNSTKAAESMSAAHEAFEGNPSLEWSVPSVKISVVKHRTALNLAPIEPNWDGI